jgi:hypothetical protein
MEKRESDRSDKRQEHQEENSNERDASHRGKVFRLCHPFVEQPIRVPGARLAAGRDRNAAATGRGLSARRFVGRE